GDQGHDDRRQRDSEPPADQPVHDRGEQGGGSELHHQQQQQNQVQGAGRLLDQRPQLGGAPPVFFLQVDRPDPVGPGDAGLRHGQERGDRGEHGHRGQAPDVGGGQAAHEGSPLRQRPSSSVVRACMARSSSGSAWSKPHRCRMPCTVNSSSSAARLPLLRVACSAATAGQSTMSPSSQGASSSSSSSPASSSSGSPSRSAANPRGPAGPSGGPDAGDGPSVGNGSTTGGRAPPPSRSF